MSNLKDIESKLQIVETQETPEIKEEEPSTSGMSGDRPQKRAGRRPGRRSSKMDVRAKLERSRQSARECRARKKLRYQYLEDLVANREKAVFALRDELEMYKQWCIQMDSGFIPAALLQIDELVSHDEVQGKKLGLEKIAEDNFGNSNNTSTNLQERMDAEPYSADFNVNRLEVQFNGSNSGISDFSEGDSRMENSFISEGASGSVDDDFKWTLEGDIIRIEPKNKDSIFKRTNVMLPTIFEETGQ